MKIQSQPHEFRQTLHRLKKYFGRYGIFAGAGVILALVTLLPTYAKNTEKHPGADAPIPVTATTVEKQSMPVWLDAQGTVTPRNYVNVMPRVAGLLESINFKEGQPVRAGQLLDTIDPRPYRIQLEQAQAQLAKDRAQLDGAQSDLVRYETLLKQESIAEQQVTDQRALVAQLAGTIAMDKAAVDNAGLQLDWTRITAPSSGIAGLRQVDAGNMVGTSGAIGGGTSALSGTVPASTPIVTIAQVQPVSVTFAIAQTQLPAILERMRAKADLPVQAWDQRRKSLLDSGKIIAADNQINTATGTVMLKSEFPNSKMALFPNQFVNVRLLIDTLKDAVVVPSAAIAIGAPGSYVYVIDSTDKVAVRKVTTSASNLDYTAITSGLKVGERVVTDGLDRLREGSMVKIVAEYGVSKPANSGTPDHNKADKSGLTKHRAPPT
ncbi:MAG TPA: efflux RND transporter periplasmic adaptor subunit [Gallionella sp.]|nr:efflux RND transporter periplasmic adaptor subunit [Gallionella sp.]